ncbi:efflux RND transporter periplasmic adaptor subunit [Crenalkalicoccus roseus]|uniref:efflux RND transporter periplasmic adaptor subunit n=1 Tax=Crenalkalicoccus roseus TaxID=1485588 RepID=UPI0013053726|nr:efflux RND transporter periplasmic adaptor subunit [Crenalkalicoccus roseus]
MRRALLPALVLAGLGAGLLWFGAPVATAFNLPWPGAGAEGAGPRLRTAVADRGPITAAVSATGTVNPVVTVQVGSQLSGQIRELLADFNSRVVAGQPIARLDTAQIEARRAAAAADLQAAEAQVAVARAAAEKAEADAAQAGAQREAAVARVTSAEAALRDAEYEADRTAQLRRSGTGPARDAVRAGFNLDRMRADLDGARATVAQMEANHASALAAARTARAQVEAAEAARAQRAAQLRQVEVDLHNATIRAPIDGIVISRNVALGQTVAASFQAPVLFQIAASLEEMEVWAVVDEADIGRIRPGQEAAFSVAAYPGQELIGTVKEIRLAAETISNVVTYTVVITAPNPRGRLLPGMTATLRIVADHRPEALRVPNAALRWRPPGQQAAAGPAGAGLGALEQALEQLPDLTDSQRAEIAAAQAELRERIAALPRDEGRQRQVQSLRQRMVARINAVLTPEQRARLAETRGGRGSAGTVWVLEGGAPRPVAVRLGITDGTHTEIVAGALEAGQEVVVGQERGTAPPRTAARPF